MVSDVRNALERLMAKATGTGGVVDNLARLSGGANMESSSFDFAGSSYVLRRSPSDVMTSERAFGHAEEAAVIRAAFASGVRSPEVIAVIEPGDDIGSGYVMRRIDAQVDPVKILGNPPPSLLNDLAEEAARIHAVPLHGLPSLPAPTPTELLTAMKAQFDAFGGDRPVLALALKWLNDHVAESVEPVLLHGDFRMGNVMVDSSGLAAVLDWELVHLGDPLQDLAYGCINSWRFGHIDKPAFGCGSFEDLWETYETASGRKVDRARFQWWLIYSTLWWGLCCLKMAAIWRSGSDPSLERAVIGRRCSEAEVDLLMLLEHYAPVEERKPVVFTQTTAIPPLGEPAASEILSALARWLETSVKQKAEGRERFMAAVALNAIGMLSRETTDPISVHDAPLCAEILAGAKGLASPGLLANLKRIALRKLGVDQPRYSAYARARQLWGIEPDGVRMKG